MCGTGGRLVSRLIPDSKEVATDLTASETFRTRSRVETDALRFIVYKCKGLRTCGMVVLRSVMKVSEERNNLRLRNVKGTLISPRKIDALLHSRTTAMWPGASERKESRSEPAMTCQTGQSGGSCRE